MTKRFVWLLLLQLVVMGLRAQSLQDLENNPSFKGFVVGAPIGEFDTKLSYEKSYNGYHIYRIKDSYCYSVFNVRMNQARVITRNGKIYAIELIKQVKGSQSNPTVFDTNELEIIESGLKEKYGNPTHGLTEQGEVVRTGTQWNSATKQVSTFIDFYGTFQGYRLVFALCEREIDF